MSIVRWNLRPVKLGVEFSPNLRLRILNRYRPKGVLRKGVGKNKNASEMRQKYVKNAPNVSCFIG